MSVIPVAAPTTFTQWTVSASLYAMQPMEKPFPFTLQSVAEKEQYPKNFQPQ